MAKEYYKRTITEFEFLPPSEAKEKGYIPYAGPYRPVTEEWMLINAVTDILKKGRDKYCLVRTGSFVDIWIIPSFYKKGYVYGVHDKAETDAEETGETTEEEIILPESDQPEESEPASLIQSIKEDVAEVASLLRDTDRQG